MALELSGYKFEGPFLTTSPVKNDPGVYVVLGDKNDNDFKLIDVGEAEKLRDALDKNEKKSCWESLGLTRLAVAVHYTPGADGSARAEIGKAVQDAFDPPCARG